MAELGGSSDFPFDCGGEPSREMKSYVAIRRMVGEGGSPPGDPYGDETIIESWRMARARGLAAIGSFAEAALWQAFPDTVSDELATYEETLAIFQPVGTPDEKRRQLVTERWTRSIQSAVSKLVQQLVAIDSRFAIVSVPRDFVRQVIAGRVYDDIDADTTGTFLNLREHSSFPNYSDDFILRVMFAIGDVPLNDELAAIRTRASDLLAEALPAWCDFAITHAQGFTLDLSLLDSGSFYP